MKKVLKRIGYVLLGLVLIVNGYILLSGNLYLYNVLRLTVFKGNLGPSIDEYPAFANDTVKTGVTQPWRVSDNANHTAAGDELTAAHTKYQTVAYLVIEKDEIIHEAYFDGYGTTSKSNSFSMAKSIVAACVGSCIQQGLIKGVDQPLSDFFPEYAEGFVGRPIVLRDLLTMSSGIGFDEHYLNPLAYPARANYGESLRELNTRYQPETQPGNVFDYQSGTTQLLAFVVKEASGLSVSEYASTYLWTPMGAEEQALWSKDYMDGDEKAFCCFNSNARDFARFGKLYLNYGNWNGQQLVDSTFVAESRVPAMDLATTLGEVNMQYSYQWWTFPKFNGAYDVFYMRGILGQYVFVIPELEIIVVRLGHKRSNERTDGYPNDIFDWLNGALEIAGYES